MAKKKQSTQQKDATRKGKDRMSYYLRRKLEKEQEANAEAGADPNVKQIEYYQKKVDADGNGEWKLGYYTVPKVKPKKFQ